MSDELPHHLPPPVEAAPEGDDVQSVLPPLSKTFGARTTFRSLRHRDYRLYFIGQIISLTGSWMQMTALTWLAYTLTRQSKWTTWIAAAQLLPTFVLAMWTGSLADRWPKRSVIFATQSALLVLALLLALLVATGAATVWSLLAVATISGVVLAVDLPARLAFVHDLVGRDRNDLMNAVALNSVLFNVARVVGPQCADQLLLWVGPVACFVANGLSYVAVLIALACMNARGEPHPVQKPRSLATLLHGFSALKGRPRLLFLVLAAGVMAMCGWPFLNLLPALATDLGGDPRQDYSRMLSGTGVGALTAALTVATFGSWERGRSFLVAGVVVVSAALIALSRIDGLWVAWCCCVSIGYGLILFFATGQSVVQLSAGDHNRGRLMGIWAMTLSGATPLGNLLVGPAADEFGVKNVLGVQGVVCGVAVLILGLSSIFCLRRQSAVTTE